MNLESEFDEVVLFEIPEECADKLWLRLQPNRLAWLHRNELGLYVVTALRVEPDDLALLLRDVQKWMADADLAYLIFVLDGREYELRAETPALAGRAA